jgi:pre-mRNA-splicing factor 18
MDALKAEIASKRKAIQNDPVESSRPTKYMRRGDIERLKQEQELEAKEDGERNEREERERRDEAAALKKATRMKVCVCLSYLVSDLKR